MKRGGWGPRPNNLKAGPVPSSSKPTVSLSSFKPTYTASGKKEEQKGKVTVLQDGLVHLSQIIDLDTQQYIYDKVFEIGAGSDKEGGGFYSLNGSALKLNMGKRGRVIEPMDLFPPKFKELCDFYLTKAMSVDPTVPTNDVNTLLINFYSPGGTFKWHKDSEDPNLIREGKGKPIISFSIGLTADFCYKNHYEDSSYSTVKLQSGDVLIFGGPSRMIVHSVQQIYPHTMPVGLRMRQSGEGRLNLTFRDVVGVLDETQFPKFRVSYANSDYIDSEKM